MSCDVKNFSQYLCDSKPKGLPVVGAGENGTHVSTPYAYIKFRSYNAATKKVEARIISTGNLSSPNNNLACIQSFEYSFETSHTGWGITIEILDNGANVYEDILVAMNKSLSEATSEYFQTEVDFGWIHMEKNGVSHLYTANRIAQANLKGILLSADTTFDGANVKIKLKLSTPILSGSGDQQTGAKGRDSNLVNLKDAIRRLWNETPPKTKVKFKDMFNGELKFSNSSGGPNGPKNRWPVATQDKVTTVRSWISSLTTSNGKGILFAYDAKENAFVLQEDPTGAGCCSRHLATYVVNGGNCSPVISFTPTVEWIASGNNGPGAAISGPTSGKSGEKTQMITEKDKIQARGSIVVKELEEHQMNWRMPEQQSVQTRAATQANKKTSNSNGIGPMAKPSFQGELKIIGDPSFSDPIAMRATTLSILFLNPYSLRQSSFNQTAARAQRTVPFNWLNTPEVNQILTNKNWRVTDICHQINNGNYVTIFKVRLEVPNVDVNAKDPLGGQCGHYTFENSKPGDKVSA